MRCVEKKKKKKRSAGRSSTLKYAERWMISRTTPLIFFGLTISALISKRLQLTTFQMLLKSDLQMGATLDTFRFIHHKATLFSHEDSRNFDVDTQPTRGRTIRDRCRLQCRSRFRYSDNQSDPQGYISRLFEVPSSVTGNARRDLLRQ